MESRGRYKTPFKVDRFSPLPIPQIPYLVYNTIPDTPRPATAIRTRQSPGRVSVIMSDNKLLSANQSQNSTYPMYTSTRDYYPLAWWWTTAKAATTPGLPLQLQRQRNDNEVKANPTNRIMASRVYMTQGWEVLSMDPLTKVIPCLGYSINLSKTNFMINSCFGTEETFFKKTS